MEYKPESKDTPKDKYEWVRWLKEGDAELLLICLMEAVEAESWPSYMRETHFDGLRRIVAMWRRHAHQALVNDDWRAMVDEYLGATVDARAYVFRSGRDSTRDDEDEDERPPEVIGAEVWPDDAHELGVTFNAAAFFRWASDDMLVALARGGWAENETAAHAAWHVARDFPEVADVLTDVYSRRQRGAHVEFEAAIDEAEARAWLAEHRPEVLRRIDAAERGE
jgi:hypothetical protein